MEQTEQKQAIQKIYLEIAVNIPQVSSLFHYHLPSELAETLQAEKTCPADDLAGRLVIVPFGNQTVQGVVLRRVETPSISETRPLIDILDREVSLTAQQLKLAQSMAENTLSSLAACLSLMLPPGLAQQADTLYSLTDPQSLEKGQPQEVKSSTQARLLSLLTKRGPLRGQQIDHSLARLNWRPAARALVQHGVLKSAPVLPPVKVQPKQVRTVQLACTLETGQATLASSGRKGSAATARRQAMLQRIAQEGGPLEVAWVYAETGGTLADLKILAELGLVTLSESEVWRDPLAKLDLQAAVNEAIAPELTRDQKAVWEEIKGKLRSAAEGQEVLPILLHGVTGSGKTEIYLQAVQETLALGRQVIILVPEIALTPQTVRRFAGRFPGQVGILHSGLSNGERYDTWRRARAGDLAIMVGPRSALFTPFERVGLIVVDECHDDSFYQSEIPPHYHAGETAITYARLNKAVCLSGSATPGLVNTYHAQQKHWTYLHLPNRILAHHQAVQAQMKRLGLQEEESGIPHYHSLEGQADTIDLPPVKIIDMRRELQEGNRSIFSKELQSALSQVLERKQQAILFLNRRGTATYIFCRACGNTLKCPRCDTPMTYHEPERSLTCHYCGYRRNVPQSCPACGSPHIRQYGTGTESVETGVQALFPQARTLRWDYETTRTKGAHEIILSHFIAHRADILIGTQMIAKGLDLPFITLVGVVLADVGLGLPDYRANERTFQILTQVAGRAGRSPLGGRVILQTFQPEHHVIQAAARHDYQAFYQQELENRRKQGYPPFNQLVRLEFRHTQADQAEHTAQELASRIKEWLVMEDRRATQMIGPVPCFFGRLNGQYRWQIILRGPNPVSLLRGKALADWRIEINPPSLL